MSLIFQKKMIVSILMLLTFLSISPDIYALSALDEWNDAAREALPLHVKIWLGLMMLNNISAMFFLKNHVPARWVFAGFVVSHGIVMAMWSQAIPVLAGQVSLFHIIFWTPGAFFVLRSMRDVKWGTPYSIWGTLVLVFYTGSMIVDFREAGIYLYSLIS